MDFGIHGKVALVAAASRGLGRAAALQLSREGAKVAICSRTEMAIKEARDEIVDETGGKVLAITADVTDKEQVQDMMDEVAAEFGSVDILVTNAGGPPAGLAEEFAPADYRTAIEMNLMSTIRLCYQVLPGMKANKWGRIIAVTSVAAKQPVNTLILSNTARSGVQGFLKTLSVQVAKDGITVNAVCPGYTKTERIEELAGMYAISGKGTVADFYKNIEVEVPMGRMGSPAEFANVVAFLASKCASYVTGVALQIDGGFIKGLY
jgi:3-oxoacyl-[acyl-carrier protein] reductase